nr:hypothetical protein [Bacteroides sp. 224]
MAVSATIEIDSVSTKKEEKGRLTLGGYGEAVMTRNFYSDNWKRYTASDLYKDAPDHGKFDLPHVTFMVGYEFGKGWRVGAEIEYEHGGPEVAVEIEEEETGEYESEVERGGEVTLEQFWIEKTFNRAMNLRMGHIVVPVGRTNQFHLPTEFFTVYRPEGENSIMPCTWHQTGVSLWGNIKKWRYEVQFIAGLDADRFGSKNWIKDGAKSPYEFKIANSYAGAFRLDNYAVQGLRLGLSGYIGKSAANSLKHDKFKDIDGLVMIAAFDFDYKDYNWIARGNFDYGHLGDSRKISEANRTMSAYSPSPRTNVASDAMCASLEVGYDVFSQFDFAKGRKLYAFARYDYYDSMYKTDKKILDQDCWERKVISAGLNYYPINNIVIKAEYSNRLLKSQFNNEPSISLGIAYAGFFTK